MRIFYSWQSDINKNRRFIQECLEAAIERLNIESTLIDAQRDEYELDHDTKSVLGIPDITATIFNKIDNCDLFVADVTFVGKSPSQRMLPNPNVLIELGYAISRLGSERILLIMDNAQGQWNDIPFDLRHKRHGVSFSSTAEREPEKKQLTGSLFSILRDYNRSLNPKPNEHVDIDLRLAYEKSNLSALPDEVTRSFALEVFAKTSGSTTLKDYKVKVILPRAIVLESGQTGKELHRESDGTTIVFQFPASEKTPLPTLFAGERIPVAQVLGAINKRNLPQRESIIQNNIRIEVFGDGIPPQTRTYSLASLDPFRLSEVKYANLDFNTRYELSPLPVA